MKRNNLREIVDREFATLTWDESKSRRVLDALEPAPTPALPVRRKLSMAVVLAVLLTLLATTALAVALIRYSPRVSLETQARQLLMAQYGMTRETLGLFTSEVTEAADESVVTFTAALWDDELTGVYTVRFRDGQATASWSYDDIDPDLWQDGEFAAPVWGVAQLKAYLAQDADQRPSIPYELAHPRDTDYLAELRESIPDPDPDIESGFWDGERWIAQRWDGQRWIYDDEWVEGDLTYAQAEDIARAALVETFDLPESSTADIEFFDAILYPGENGQHTWTLHGFLYLDDVDLNMYAEIDAQSGEVLSIGLETGGNG